MFAQFLDFSQNNSCANMYGTTLLYSLNPANSISLSRDLANQSHSRGTMIRFIQKLALLSTSYMLYEPRSILLPTSVPKVVGVQL